MTVNLYFFPLENLTPALRKSALNVLNEEEYARYSRCVEQVQIEFSLGRYMTKTVLAKHLACDPKKIEFAFNKNGKPYVDSGPQFSISHCKSAVAVATANFPVGVDVEQIHRARNPKLQEPWEMAEAFLNEDMAVQIQNFPSDEEKAMCFTQLWTCLESQVKMLGSSVFTVRENFLLRCEDKLYFPLNNETRQCYFTTWQLQNNSLISLATPEACEVNIFEWHENGLKEINPSPVVRSTFSTSGIV